MSSNNPKVPLKGIGQECEAKLESRTSSFGPIRQNKAHVGSEWLKMCSLHCVQIKSGQYGCVSIINHVANKNKHAHQKSFWHKILREQLNSLQLTPCVQEGKRNAAADK